MTILGATFNSFSLLCLFVSALSLPLRFVSFVHLLLTKIAILLGANIAVVILKIENRRWQLSNDYQLHRLTKIN